MSLLNRLRRRMSPSAGPSALELFRPNLGPTPLVARRFLEPIVAIVAFSMLIGLVSVGMSALFVMMAASLLIVAILNYVFGIRLELP